MGLHSWRTVWREQEPNGWASSVSLGGHIHFGLSPYKANHDDYYDDDEDGGKINFQDMNDDDYSYSQYCLDHSLRMKALDRFTFGLESNGILPTSKERRSQFQYGKLGQFRPHDERTEYRSMCSWLFDPKVADICLTGVKSICINPNGALQLLSVKPSLADLTHIFELAKGDSDTTRAYNTLVNGANWLTNVNKDFCPLWKEFTL